MSLLNVCVAAAEIRVKDVQGDGFWLETDGEKRCVLRQPIHPNLCPRTVVQTLSIHLPGEIYIKKGMVDHRHQASGCHPGRVEPNKWRKRAYDGGSGNTLVRKEVP